MRGASFLLVALVTMATVAGAQEGVRARIEEALNDWQRRAEPSEERLVQRLVALGPEAVPHLCAWLEAPGDTRLVGPIASALGRTGGREALGALCKLMSSPAAKHRERAATALGETTTPEALEPLFHALGDEQPRVQFAAIPAFLRLIASAAVPVPVGRLEKAVRESAHPDGYAVALARLEGEAAREALHELARDPFEERTALAALGGLWDAPRNGDAEVLHPLVLEARSPAVRKKAILLMGRLAYTPAVRDLIDLLHEDDPGEVKNAHWALVQITGNRIAADPELWESWWRRRGGTVSEQALLFAPPGD